MSKKNDIINFYEQKKVKKFMPKTHNPNYEKHLIKIPFRGIIVGSSGSGKTNMLLNLIAKMSDTFNKIYIYSRAEEPLYNYLQSQIADDMLSISYDLQDFRDFDESNYFGQTLVIFDDMCNEKNQTCINELYIRGRKLGVSSLYLTQSYYKVPKIVRLQSQYIFIIKTSGLKDLRLILSEYSLTATTDQLQKMYNFACNSGMFGNFLLIDLNAPQKKSFRLNWLEFLNPSDF
jgi:hypothetical protein